ncbi:MAG: HesA/MoeB/ThiF family protein [Candidatus Nezhaarchaeales archaeon]
MNTHFDPWEFYKRQVALAELKREGQEKLRSSKVAIVGIGGLGSVAALYLALAGVGYLRLIDQDTVELHNLHRQILYSMSDLRYPKVEAAMRRINSVNPEPKVEPIPESVRESNVEELVEGVNCVVDGLDNMQTRYLVNRACIKHGIPYVFGGAIGLEGNLSVFMPPETPCLECVFPGLDDALLPTCETRGILGATAGVIGALEAVEAVKLLAGVGGVLKGKLLICDLKSVDFSVIDVYKSPSCKACQLKVETPVKYKPTWLCGSNTVNVNPPKPLQVDLQDAFHVLSKTYKILVKSSLVLVFNYDGEVEVSLFKNGRMLIKNVSDECKALKIYEGIASRLGLK